MMRTVVKLLVAVATAFGIAALIKALQSKKEKGFVTDVPETPAIKAA